MSLDAEPEVPRVLYKYRNLSGDNRIHLREILLENKVWFSSPADFNDPFDCRVHLSFNGSRRDWEQRMSGMLKRYRPELKRQQRRAEVARIFRTEKRHKNSDVFKNVLNDAQQAINQWGVFCLSARNDDLLMWSYYANRHTGLCLGFTHLAVKPLGPALPVEYSSEFPQVDYFADDNLRQWKANLLTKASAWRHESEWRVIDRENGRGIRHFPPEALAAVIFGTRMSQEDRTEVISWIEQRSSKPALFEACLKEGFYGLEIRPLGPAEGSQVIPSPSAQGRY